MSLAEAGAVLGVADEQVRRYVRRGLLPATKIAGVWAVPEDYVDGFTDSRPRRGRPLCSRAAWDRILSGEVDLDDPQRYANRGVVSRWIGGVGMIADLLNRGDVVVGGMHAAHVHGALLDPLADAAHIYVAEASMNSRGAAYPMSGLLAAPLGEVVVRAVAAGDWERLRESASTAEGVRYPPLDSASVLYAPAEAAALDLVSSPHPREQYAAEAILNDPYGVAVPPQRPRR